MSVSRIPGHVVDLLVYALPKYCVFASEIGPSDELAYISPAHLMVTEYTPIPLNKKVAFQNQPLPIS